MEAKKAASAAKRATEEAEQKRINSLVGEHLQKIEKIMKNIQAEMNNMNKNNELSVKNETIARYRKLQKNIHAINPIYANIARTLGKNAKNQYPNLHSRILNLNQRIRNTINTNQLEARKYAAAQRGAAAGGMSRSARNQNWVLMGLPRTATKANVLKRFRNMSRSGNYMHPNRLEASGAALSVQAKNAQNERFKLLTDAKNRIISNIERGL
jgi:exonuclease VII large subunit